MVIDAAIGIASLCRNESCQAIDDRLSRELAEHVLTGSAILPYYLMQDAVWGSSIVKFRFLKP